MADRLPGTDVPTVERPSLSADRRRTERRRALLDAGVHPATGRKLAGNGETCATCVHHQAFARNRTWHKCLLAGVTHGPATDIRVSWPACEAWEVADG